MAPARPFRAASLEKIRLTNDGLLLSVGMDVSFCAAWRVLMRRDDEQVRSVHDEHQDLGDRREDDRGDAKRPHEEREGHEDSFVVLIPERAMKLRWAQTPTATYSFRSTSPLRTMLPYLDEGAASVVVGRTRCWLKRSMDSAPWRTGPDSPPLDDP